MSLFTNFKQKAIETSKHTPSVWYRYEDDTFVIWKQGQEKVHQYLNSHHNNIKFTMKLKEENQIPFLDILVTRVEEYLEHKVYLKPTHPDWCPHKLSNYHPGQK